METYFRAFGYDKAEKRVTYGSEYNTDLTIEPMYRFMISMSLGAQLPYGFAEVRRFNHTLQFNADHGGHVSVVLGVNEEGYSEHGYTGPLRDDEVELKVEFFQDIWFWDFTLLSDWEKSLVAFGDIESFVKYYFPRQDNDDFGINGRQSAAGADKQLQVVKH